LLGAALNIAPEEFHLVRPSVTYHPKRKYELQFDHAIAASSVPFDKKRLDLTDEVLLGLAKACFAAGVFVDELAPAAPKGDANDYTKFYCYYREAIIWQRGQPEDSQTILIAKAVAAVTADLQNPAKKSQVLAEADRLEAEILS
jgi:hypothetical protein